MPPLLGGEGQIGPSLLHEHRGLPHEGEGQGPHGQGHDDRDEIDHPPASGHVLPQKQPGQHPDEGHADEGDALGHEAIGGPLLLGGGLHDVEDLHVVGGEEHHKEHAQDVLNGALAGHDDEHAQAHADGVDHEEEPAAVPIRQGLIKGAHDQKQVGRHGPGGHHVDGGLVFGRIDVPGRDAEQIKQRVGLHGGVHVGRDLVHDVDDGEHNHGEQQIVGALGAVGRLVEPHEFPLLPHGVDLFFQGYCLLQNLTRGEGRRAEAIIANPPAADKGAGWKTCRYTYLF